MLTDKNLNPEIRHSSNWIEKLGNNRSVGSLAGSLRELPGPQGGKIPSLSGHERNHLFLNLQGKQFEDISLISGADSSLDGRAVVIFDFNRDGLLDIAVCNANAPKLSIYKNQLGKKLKKSNSLQIRLIGGADGMGNGLSNRDGYGAVITAMIGGKPFRKEHRCGTGYAAQNSSLIHIGMGAEVKIANLKIRWPSGNEQVIPTVEANSLLEATEVTSFK